MCVCARSCISRAVELWVTQTLVNEQTQTGQTNVFGVITTPRRMRMWLQIIGSFVYITSDQTSTHKHTHTSPHTSCAHAVTTGINTRAINSRHKANKIVTAEQLHDRFDIHPALKFTT